MCLADTPKAIGLLGKKRTKLHTGILKKIILLSDIPEFEIIKVTVQFERCFRLMEHISVIIRKYINK